jgi:aminoglycoside phosphotransferase (APT) family kinase protein
MAAAYDSADDSADDKGPRGLDLARLRAYLDRELPGLVRGPLSGQLISGGRSNLTYRVTDGSSRWVVRRPPLGHVLATAHDMSREHTVISALQPTAVPVPRTLAMCTDADVIGAPFFVMDEAPGIVYRSRAQTDALTTEERQALARSLVQTLADLHSVDPHQVGLDGFGHPDGFLDRQVRRWSKQLAGSRSRDLPEADQLGNRLAHRVPAMQRSSVVHGDFRLDNVLVDPSDPGRITAVLDWEMATLGDPMTDIGLLLVYWDGLGSIPNPIVEGLGQAAGFPSGTTLVEWYAERIALDLADLPWYVAFGYFKLAVILEGIHYRYLAGQTVGAGFDQIGSLVEPLVRRGLDALTTTPRPHRREDS